MLLLGAVSHSWLLVKGICTLFLSGVDTGKPSLLKSCMQSEFNSVSHKQINNKKRHGSRRGLISEKRFNGRGGEIKQMMEGMVRVHCTCMKV